MSWCCRMCNRYLTEESRPPYCLDCHRAYWAGFDHGWYAAHGQIHLRDANRDHWESLEAYENAAAHLTARDVQKVVAQIDLRDGKYDDQDELPDPESWEEEEE